MFEFTDEQRDYAREIVGLDTDENVIATLNSRLDALNDAQAASVVRDITAWKRIEYGTTRTKGGIKGTDFDTERDRLRITNKLRRTLKYPQIPTMDANSLGMVRISLGGGYRDTDEYSR